MSSETIVGMFKLGLCLTYLPASAVTVITPPPPPPSPSPQSPAAAAAMVPPTVHGLLSECYFCMF